MLGVSHRPMEVTEDGRFSTMEVHGSPVEASGQGRLAVNRQQRVVRSCVAAILVAATFMGGCQGLERLSRRLGIDQFRWFNPSKVVAKPARSPIVPILPSASWADETYEVLPNSEPPTEADYVYKDTDYILGPTDVVAIAIMDLYNDGMETVLNREISESGRIDLPLLEERIVVEGLTQEGLKETIKDVYRQNILHDPRVSVTILAKRNNTFSIIGAGRTGTYSLARRDMRLLESLALAGGVPNPNITHLYVIRPKPAMRDPSVSRIERPRGKSAADLPDLPPEIAPDAEPQIEPEPNAVPAPEVAPATKPAKTGEDQNELDNVIPGAPPRPKEPGSLPAPSAQITMSETASKATTSSAPSGDLPPRSKRTYKWVRTRDKWIRVEQEAPVAADPSGRGAPPVRPIGAASRPGVTATDKAVDDPFGWRKVEKRELARIIAINYKRLFNGDPRMNIVIRDHDVIQIPQIKIGEFYLMGEIARPGVYSLSGRRITVKMAVAAGGNLGALAWPENSYLVRRIGASQEQFIPLDLDAIFKGEAPDLVLKPNDLIAVGTDWTAPFLAVFRNAFRLSYGFGFLYDRNFADVAVGSRGLDSRRFSRW